MASNRADDQQISRFICCKSPSSTQHPDDLADSVHDPACAARTGMVWPSQCSGASRHHPSPPWPRQLATSNPTAALFSTCAHACLSIHLDLALSLSAPKCCSATINSPDDGYFAVRDSCHAALKFSPSFDFKDFPGINYAVIALNSRIRVLKPRTKLRLKFVRVLSAVRQLEASKPCTPVSFRGTRSVRDLSAVKRSLSGF